MAYWHTGQKKKGLEFIESGRVLIEKHKDQALILMTEMEIANIKILEGSFKEAKALLYRSYYKSIELGLGEYIKLTSEGLQRLYEKQGVLDSAYKYQRIYFNLKDSLSGEEMRSKLIKLNLKDKFKKDLLKTQ